jgi:hypothetical protein
MNNEYRILVAIDLETGTDRVLAETHRFSKALNAIVDIIHVTPSDPEFVGYMNERGGRDMKATIISLWLAISSLMSAHMAIALEYSLHGNDKSKTLTAILATGMIEEGDTERLGSFLRKLRLKKSVAVYLASPRGELIPFARSTQNQELSVI